VITAWLNGERVPDEKEPMENKPPGPPVVVKLEGVAPICDEAAAGSS